MVNGKGKIHIPVKAKSEFLFDFLKFYLFFFISFKKHFTLNIIIFHNATSCYIGKI